MLPAAVHLALALAPALALAEEPAPSPDPLAARVAGLVRQLLDPGRRPAARREILEIGRDATPHLLAHRDSPEFTVRWELANIQGTLRDERALDLLVALVTADPEAHVRWRALWALRQYPEPAEIAGRLRQVLVGSDRGKAWNAAVALAQFGAPDGLELLEAGVRDRDPWRRWEAIHSLGRVHGDSSAEVLGHALRSGDEPERGEAALSLGRIGGSRARDLLVGALGDSAASVRRRACDGLARIQDPAARPALEALLARERDPAVAGRAREALTRIGSTPAPGTGGAATGTAGTPP